MSAALDGAVELLDRSLAYTRVVLADVRPHHLGRPTPCSGWSLHELLAHMEDALDAFTEAAAGRVEVDTVPPAGTGAGTTIEALRDKACALLGAWAGAAARQRATGPVAVGDLGLDAPVLVVTAALEITLHGWDVAQTTGRRTPVPQDLAAGLLGVAELVIDPADRGSRFASPRPVRAGDGAAVRLLAWTGRAAPGQMTGPASANHGEAPARRGMAS